MVKKIIRWWNDASVHKKLTFSCWAAITIPLLVIFTVISVIYLKVTMNTASEQAQITLNKTTEELNTWFLQNEERVASIATDISVQNEMVAYPNLNFKEQLEFRDFIRNRLANLTTSDKRILNIYVYIDESKKAFSNDFSDKDIGAYYQGESWFQQIRNGDKTPVLDETISIQTGKKVFFIAIPVISVYDGKFLGLVYSELDSDKISDVFYPLVYENENAVMIKGMQIENGYNEKLKYFSVFSDINVLGTNVEYRICLREIMKGYYIAIAYMVAGIAVLMLIIYFTNKLFTVWFTKRIFYLRNTLITVAGGNLDLHVKDDFHDEIGELSQSLNIMIRDMKKLIHENYIVQIENQKATLKALQSQINPHFVYNTLESISMLALIHDDYDIVELTKAFSDMMRYAMNVSSYEIPVRLEVENAKNYIAIQRIRFGDRFTVSFDIQEESLSCGMLRLCLQPLVENSFKHGFNDFSDKGILKIAIKKQGGDLIIRVCNNGRAIDPERMEQIRHQLMSSSEECTLDCYAIKNLYQRLKFAYGEDCLFKIYSKKDLGTMTKIRIPAREVVL